MFNVLELKDKCTPWKLNLLATYRDDIYVAYGGNIFSLLTGETYVGANEINHIKVIHLNSGPMMVTVDSTGNVSLFFLDDMRMRPVVYDNCRVSTWGIDGFGNYLAFSDNSFKITLLDVNTGARLFFMGHTSNIPTIAFTGDGTRLLSGSIDNFIKIWRVIDQTCINTFECGSYVWNVLAINWNDLRPISPDLESDMIVLRSLDNHPCLTTDDSCSTSSMEREDSDIDGNEITDFPCVLDTLARDYSVEEVKSDDIILVTTENDLYLFSMRRGELMGGLEGLVEDSTDNARICLVKWIADRGLCVVCSLDGWIKVIQIGIKERGVLGLITINTAIIGLPVAGMSIRKMQGSIDGLEVIILLLNGNLVYHHLFDPSAATICTNTPS